MQFSTEAENKQNAWYRKYSQKLHKMRLADIKNKDSNRIDNHFPESKKIIKSTPRQKPFQTIQREEEVSRANQILVERLSQISHRKSPTIQKSVSKPLIQAAKGSLNLFKRKQELSRITEENQALLRRIESKSPVLNSKKQFEEWRTNKKYVKMLRKVKGDALKLSNKALRTKNEAEKTVTA